MDKFSLTLCVIAVLVMFMDQDAIASPLSLREAVIFAETGHPNLVSERSRAQEANAELNSLPSLPPPTIFLGVMGSRGPIQSGGRMENSIGFSQVIPYPTKLSAESNWRERRKDSAEARLRAEILKVQLEVKAAFFELYSTRKIVTFLREKKNVFNEHNRRLRSTNLSDRIFQAHRIWVETELELVANEVTTAEEAEKIAVGKLNVAMGKDPTSEITELEEPPLSNFPPVVGDLTSASSLELKSIEAESLVAYASARQAKTMWLPDFSVSYRNARRFDGVMPNYSELTVGVTLPFLFFWQANAQTTAANARAVGAEATLSKIRNELKMQLLEARTHALSVRSQLSSYETKIIPQTERRMKIAHGLVPSDMESLSEHRDAMENVIKMKMAALALRLEYEKTLAKIETLTVGENEKKAGP